MSIFGDRLLTPTELAERLGVSVGTLANMRWRGGGPPYIRMSGRCVRYRPSAVEKWISEREVSSTSEEIA